jgi:hypothetical protein
MSGWPATRLTLLERLRDPQDQLAWTEFVSLYGPLLFHFARRRLSQDEDAADVLQEVLGAVLSGKYERPKGRFQKWLVTILLNKIRDFCAAQLRRGAVSGNVLLNYGVDGYWSCYCLVYPNGNYFHLLNDAGDSWGPAYTFGLAGTAANSSCRVNAATSSRSVSGTDATATFKITFLPGVFSRPSRPISAVNSYLYVTDNAGATAGWNGPYQTSTARSGPKLIVTSQR